MKLISCERCGVVFNQDNLNFPDLYDHDSGKYIEGNGYWNGDTYVPFISCPVCTHAIPKEE